MRTHLLRVGLLPLCGVLFQFCNEPSSVVTPRQYVQPPIVIQTEVQLSVGNSYHWQYTKVSSFGNFLRWDETHIINRDTTIHGIRYFVLSSGEILKTSGDIVLSFANNSEDVYYRLDVSIGDTVPFLGYTVPVTFIDTSAVFGETQKIITVSHLPESPAGFDLARYAGKFGLIEMNTSEGTSAIHGVLVGARVGNVTYGYNP